MASLIEELIETLEKEETLYEEIIPIAEKKKRIIIENNLEVLQTITDQERILVDQVTSLEGKRREIVQNIGIVLNRKAETLDMKNIIAILSKQPEEQKKLSRIHDQLIQTVYQLRDINYQNKALIEESLEMIEFNMNFIQSTRMSSGSNNYTKQASIRDVGSSQSGMFDAKQ